MRIGLLTLHLHLPGVTSLKEKRRRIRPVLARLHKEFNISTSEVGALDSWQETVIACTLASNDSGYAQKALQEVFEFTQNTWPDLPVLDYRIELV